jgi:HAD superfamily hydrolase (TIGR01509 family)
MLQAVIFDFDGVIYNSPYYYLKTRNIFIKRYNIKQTMKEQKKQLALPTKEFIDYINKKYNLNISFDYYFKEKYKIFNKISKNKLKVNNGVKKLLKNLKQNNIKIAICSSNEKSIIKKRLKEFKLINMFDIILSSEDITRHKPYPDSFLKIAKKLNVLPKYCVGIEDAPTGIQAIKLANMKSIGILTEFTNEIDFKKVNTDLIVNSLNELNYKKIKKLIE